MTSLLKSPRAWVMTASVGLALALLAYLTGYPPLGSSRLDANMPYRIQLGRGSGWHGLDTVKV
jgi:hypothetical protein